MKIIGRRKGGWNCDQVNPDGTRTCRRIKIDKNHQRLATGTEITIGVDDQCEPVLSGDAQNILDDDEKEITNIAKKMTSQCKKERGL